MPREKSVLQVNGYAMMGKEAKLTVSGSARYVNVKVEWKNVMVIDVTDDPDGARAEATTRAGEYKFKQDNREAARLRRIKKTAEGPKKAPKSRPR
jgi:hypothetical protein